MYYKWRESVFDHQRSNNHICINDSFLLEVSYKKELILPHYKFHLSSISYSTILIKPLSRSIRQDQIDKQSFLIISKAILFFNYSFYQ